MAYTPDRSPGEADEEGIILNDRGSAGDGAGAPTEDGGIRYVDGAFSMRDAVGLFDPRSGGTPTAVGQFLYSADGVTFSPRLPIVSGSGIILVNVDGTVMVV